MTAELKEQKHRVLEELRSHGARVASAPRSLTDDQIFAAIIGQTAPVTAEEAQAEDDSTEPCHYDEWIFAALHDRKKGRCQLDGGGKEIEHPTARVFRLGLESIKAGKTSQLFLVLLEEIGKRAERSDALSFLSRVFQLGLESINSGKPSQMFIALLIEIGSRPERFDVLSSLFPRDFRIVDDAQLTSYANKERVIKDYREMAKANRGKKSFKNAKAAFKLKQQEREQSMVPESIDRILKEYGMDFKAKPGRDRELKRKSVKAEWDSWGYTEMVLKNRT